MALASALRGLPEKREVLAPYDKRSDGRLAKGMLSRTRIYRLLKGYRNLPATNLDAIALTMIRVAQLVIDLPEVVELDINPLLADEYGVVALDARIKVCKASGKATARLAIRPYPKELEEDIPLGDGRTLLLRPILPEDEPSLQAAFAKLTPEEVRLRFFIPMSTPSHVTAARFTQIDYDHEMALILAEPGIPGKMEIFGVVRIIADPDNQRAEYAIVVRHDMTGLGLGILLMRRIIDYASERGNYATNNVAKNHVNWGIRIRRECLSGFYRKSPEAHISLFLDMDPIPSQRRKR